MHRCLLIQLNPWENAVRPPCGVGVVAFEAMKVAQLSAELTVRGSTRAGVKAVLQRRLHALVVQAARARRERLMWTI